MSIEFIRDDFLEGKKEELININKVLGKKVKKPDRNVIFLRRFTLALMGQYKVRKKHLYEKRDEIEMLNRQIMHQTKQMHQFKRPVQRMMPPPPLQVPKPQIPTPLKEELKVPNPIYVDVPKEKVNTLHPV